MNINEPPDPRSSMWAWIAYSLRFHRMQRGLTGDAVGKLLNCARSSVSRLENGEAKLDEKQAAVLDEAWNTGGLFSIMVWYARQGHDPMWFKSFTEFEARSSLMKQYSGQLIPALLQTPAYASALLLAGRETEIDKAVNARIARQAILDQDNPPELWVLLAETALQVRVGGKDVMREQLAHLLKLSALPHITLRIVPNTAGANPGLDGSFKIIKVREGEIAFVEAPNGGRLVAEVAEVESFKLRFDRIGAVALPVDSSQTLIKKHMEALS
ncbi:helix-turn-helix transcriptional regulator [Actinomadura sp. BRA 177]|uniref:helix-turn-helix domain-containing protein n=1 Tax=Actinomadura sp. BRA 177 TaxID=2745202 RepID=UPI001595E71D|nr:helix-turn-helix transcriptional regulator [Actinomadura sp. BRA 177]NVI90927.1 helix-turn-helix transcriptional regulator [Actinomadura sp. BRA 177]